MRAKAPKEDYSLLSIFFLLCRIFHLLLRLLHHLHYLPLVPIPHSSLSLSLLFLLPLITTSSTSSTAPSEPYLFVSHTEQPIPGIFSNPYLYPYHTPPSASLLALDCLLADAGECLFFHKTVNRISHTLFFSFFSSFDVPFFFFNFFFLRVRIFCFFLLFIFWLFVLCYIYA